MKLDESLHPVEVGIATLPGGFEFALLSLDHLKAVHRDIHVVPSFAWSRMNREHRDRTGFLIFRLYVLSVLALPDTCPIMAGDCARYRLFRPTAVTPSNVRSSVANDLVVA